MYKPSIAKSVYISPSTQDHNIGVGKYGSEERVMNLIADVVVPILEFNGIKCWRNSPRMTFLTVTADSNKKLPGIHLPIHSNATGLTNSTRRGCEVYYAPGSVSGKKLAECLYKRVSTFTPEADRGVKEAKYNELVDTLAPSALIEVDYHDNLESASWILQHIEGIGVAISLSVCDYFGIEGKLPTKVVNDNVVKARDLLLEAQKMIAAATELLNK